MFDLTMTRSRFDPGKQSHYSGLPFLLPFLSFAEYLPERKTGNESKRKRASKNSTNLKDDKATAHIQIEDR
jgi:hypothetical protein